MTQIELIQLDTQGREAASRCVKLINDEPPYYPPAPPHNLDPYERKERRIWQEEEHRIKQLQTL